MFKFRRVPGTVVYGFELILLIGVRLSLGMGPEWNLSTCTAVWRRMQMGRLGIRLGFDLDALTLGMRYERSDDTVGNPGKPGRHHYLSIGLLCLDLLLDWPSRPEEGSS